jgi:hypothetical protein
MAKSLDKILNDQKNGIEYVDEFGYKVNQIEAKVS